MTAMHQRPNGPSAPADDATAGEPAPTPRPRWRSPMAEEPPCVLVVDDDPDLRTALAELISAAGYHVLTATNGRDAVVLAAEHPPRLVLLDLVMPVMDGHAALAALRDLPTRIPVVCMSAGLRARAAAEQHAVAGYLEKPFGVAELLRLVASFCE